jgi:glycosyltransferase involved in cell wall biosynthesis
VAPRRQAARPFKVVPRAPHAAPQISVVVPIFNEAESVEPLYTRLHQAMSSLGRDYELIFVDDGSLDGSFERLKSLTRLDHHVRLIRFRRNFGQTAALQAGIEQSRGQILVFMDADLQNDPDDVAAIVAKLEEGYDVVSGWRRDRQDPFLTRRLPSQIANSLISFVTGVRLRDYGCTLKGYRREVIEGVKLYGEMHRFIPALASLSGASVTEIPVHHHARRFGRSKYGLSRTVRVLIDLMTVKFLGSYGTKPNYAFGFIAILLWMGALLAAAVVAVKKFIPPYPEAHNNPLLLLAVFLAILGVQFMMLGLLAELIVRTYHESQGKSIYVIREAVEQGARRRAA